MFVFCRQHRVMLPLVVATIIGGAAKLLCVLPRDEHNLYHTHASHHDLENAHMPYSLLVQTPTFPLKGTTERAQRNNKRTHNPHPHPLLVIASSLTRPTRRIIMVGPCAVAVYASQTTTTALWFVMVG